MGAGGEVKNGQEVPFSERVGDHQQIEGVRGSGGWYKEGSPSRIRGGKGNREIFSIRRRKGGKDLLVLCLCSLRGK